MTKPRDNPGRLLFGILGSLPDTSEQKRYWNHLFEDLGIDGFLDHYPTKEEELPERLSEMFHFDRRGYIVSESLQRAIIPLLDHIDSSAEGEGRASVIVNIGGVLIGYYVDDRTKIQSLWFQE